MEPNKRQKIAYMYRKTAIEQKTVIEQKMFNNYSKYAIAK